MITEKKQLYFDSAATTIPSEAAKKAATEAFEAYGNPSSLHSCGLQAKKLIDTARERVAAAFGCSSEELYFTASGTESDNTAIFGAARMKARHSKVIVSTDSEHPAVEQTLKALESVGSEVIRLSTRGGVINQEELTNALNRPVSLVTVMQVNNETGAIYDLHTIRQIIDKSGCGALLHSDAVQSFLKLPSVYARSLARDCDLVSMSAHKVNAFKGVGALYIKKGINLPPYIYGGGQEKGLRSGTENTVGISAFGAAVAELKSMSERIDYLYKLREYACTRLKELLGDCITINLPAEYAPTLLSISLEKAKSENMLNLLSLGGICVSASSACSARKKDNRVLSAFGLSQKAIESTLRISFSHTNTFDEAETLCTEIKKSYERLVRLN